MTDTGEIRRTRAPAPAQDRPGFRPLYAQVKDLLVARLVEGVWKPGDALPSEQQLAAELGVSPGTVRKALDEMTAENTVVRRQGRGTYVAEHSGDQVLFRFYRLTGDDGRRSLPESRQVRLRSGVATRAERDRLGLGADGVGGARPKVWRIDRDRLIDGRPLICERIVLGADRFPALDRFSPLPNNVYQLYALEYGASVARAEEKLKAVAATADEAARLGVDEGTPLLEIDRLAHGLDGTALEWRLSRCLTEGVHYGADLV